ncbi:alginate O-acetyltransferase [Pararhizobium antarcticum]|uniref:alginate O-acetyltransferase n=1 Tax=Pararhizobium antarcticum TaxID=1798805 RepID=UPI0009F8C40A|nr:alginate O-acetyltransferase [Pararhizobium antarcticum]
MTYKTWKSASVITQGLFVFLLSGVCAAQAAPGACPKLSAPGNTFALEPGLGGVFFRTSTDLEEFFARTSETIDTMRDIADALKIKGTELVFVPLPPRGIVQRDKLDTGEPIQARYNSKAAIDEFRLYVQQLKKGGLNTVDVLQAITTAHAEEDFFYARDHHWTTKGAQLTAKAVGEVVKKLEIYNTLPHYNFETVQTGTLDYISGMGHEIQSLCGSAIDTEKDAIWSTTRNADDATDLFADQAAEVKPAALVGSSFSATPEFNFAGFLSQEVSLDFTNYAENGAEFISSLATLLFSKRFQTEPPPLIVWEAPSYYDVDQTMFKASRQILGAIYGPCNSDLLLASSSPTRKPDQQQILSVDAKKGIKSNGTYLELDASQAGLNKLTVTVEYANGDNDIITLGGFARFVDDGRFFLKLSDEFTAPVTGISIDDKLGNTSLTAKLCRVPRQYMKQQG